MWALPFTSWSHLLLCVLDELLHLLMLLLLLVLQREELVTKDASLQCISLRCHGHRPVPARIALQGAPCARAAWRCHAAASCYENACEGPRHQCVPELVQSKPGWLPWSLERLAGQGMPSAHVLAGLCQHLRRHPPSLADNT